MPCLHSLMQTLEWVWENSKVCVNPRRRGWGLHKLSHSPKLSLVFASGYVNTARVIYFLILKWLALYNFVCVCFLPVHTTFWKEQHGNIQEKSEKAKRCRRAITSLWLLYELQQIFGCTSDLLCVASTDCELYSCCCWPGILCDIPYRNNRAKGEIRKGIWLRCCSNSMLVMLLKQQAELRNIRLVLISTLYILIYTNSFSMRAPQHSFEHANSRRDIKWAKIRKQLQNAHECCQLLPYLFAMTKSPAFDNMTTRSSSKSSAIPEREALKVAFLSS